MALFALFENSATSVDINPEYDFKDAGRKIESAHRTQSGEEYSYTWGNYRNIKFGVKYVNSSFMCMVNSWYGANTSLQFMEVGVPASEISVRLVGKNSPVTQNIMPYRDLFQGVIELETF